MKLILDGAERTADHYLNKLGLGINHSATLS